MCDSEHTSDSKIRSSSRFEKPFRPFRRNQSNFIRRPFPSRRRRGMSGRYRNTGFRPFVRPYRPDFPRMRGIPPNYRCQPPPNLSVPVTPPGIERPELPNAPLNNSCNRNVQYPITPRPAMGINYNGNQAVVESPDFRFAQSNDQNFSDLWVETLSPSGRTYYYNARTRETKWDKPLNVRTIDLNEIKRLTDKPVLDQSQNLPKENQNLFVNTIPPSSYISPFLPGPRNFIPPSRMMMFPPPTNIRVAPPIFMTTAPRESLQETAINKFRMLPPPMFPLPVISGNTVTNIEINDRKNDDIFKPSNSLQFDTSELLFDSKKYDYSKNKISDWSLSESKISLNVEENVDEKGNEKNESVIQMDLDKSAICKNEDNKVIDNQDILKSQDASFFKVIDDQENLTPQDVSSFKLIGNQDMLEIHNKYILKTQDSSPVKIIDNQDTVETQDVSPLNESKAFSEESIEKTEKKSEEKIVDKSRPVSSTPVQGTCWCVVWTGDEKVFFYDSQNKLSVWERPNELNDRRDVDKLIEKPPLQTDVKPNITYYGPNNATSDTDISPFKSDLDNTSASFNTGASSPDLENIPNTNTTSRIKIVLDSSNTSCVKKLRKDTEVEEKPPKLSKNTENLKEKDCADEKGPNPAESMSHEERVKIFRELLTEKNVSPTSTWEKELHKVVFDSRYLLLHSKERKQIFESYILEKLEEQKICRQKELQQQKEKFRSLLEEAGVNSKTFFSDFAQQYGKDMRFKLIEKIKQKENLFNQYIRELEKKEKELETFKLQQKRNFISLLNALKIHDKITWHEVEKKISNDERYKAIQSRSVKEKIFRDYINEHSQKSTCNTREERANASIRNREEEVKRDLSIHLKDREREQELHKHKSTISNVKAFLDDLIKDSDISWHSAKKILKEDHRWDFVQCLEPEEREELFNQHIDSLNLKKKEQFRCLLDEMPNMTLKTSWLDIRKNVLTDARCAKFSSSERKCEKEFKEYLRQKILLAKSDFKKLLKETKIITYKSKSVLKTSNHLRDIENVLSKDKRYLNLECLRGERREILLSYIDKLHSRGPPPPPTACEPPYRK